MSQESWFQESGFHSPLPSHLNLYLRLSPQVGRCYHCFTQVKYNAHSQSRSEALCCTLSNYSKKDSGIISWAPGAKGLVPTGHSVQYPSSSPQIWSPGKHSVAKACFDPRSVPHGHRRSLSLSSSSAAWLRFSCRAGLELMQFSCLQWWSLKYL